MVVLSSRPILENFVTPRKFTAGVPVVDLSRHDAKTRIVAAAEEFGFFKVINSGIPIEFLENLEKEARDFFKLPLPEKQKPGAGNPYGYGNKNIGAKGDVGWVEYLLFTVNLNSGELFPGISTSLRELLIQYTQIVKRMASEVLELMAEELGVPARDCFSKMINEENSDCLFRLNHYPPSPAMNLVGFGEHTDPQIISVCRSNNISGLQICLRDGGWLAVPPDHTSFFFNVGDSLQVLTNGRFKSVKHRVVAEGIESRISMIFFGGPAMNVVIKPVTALMADGEESFYNEFTWSEYKKSAYKTRLGENRLRFFEKFSLQ